MAIKDRITRLEAKAGGTDNFSLIPKQERIVVIPYPADQEQEFERLREERIAELKQKYGPTINLKSLMFIGIRKFCPNPRPPY